MWKYQISFVLDWYWYHPVKKVKCHPIILKLFTGGICIPDQSGISTVKTSPFVECSIFKLILENWTGYPKIRHFRSSFGTAIWDRDTQASIWIVVPFEYCILKYPVFRWTWYSDSVYTSSNRRHHSPLLLMQQKHWSRKLKYKDECLLWLVQSLKTVFEEIYKLTKKCRWC